MERKNKVAANGKYSLLQKKVKYLNILLKYSTWVNCSYILLWVILHFDIKFFIFTAIVNQFQKLDISPWSTPWNLKSNFLISLSFYGFTNELVNSENNWL